MLWVINMPMSEKDIKEVKEFLEKVSKSYAQSVSANKLRWWAQMLKQHKPLIEQLSKADKALCEKIFANLR